MKVYESRCSALIASGILSVFLFATFHAPNAQAQSVGSSDPCAQPPNWAAIASGFLTPHLGGFFGSLGNVSRELSQERNERTQCEASLAQQRAIQSEQEAIQEQQEQLEQSAQENTEPSGQSSTQYGSTEASASPQDSSPPNMHCEGRDSRTWNECVATIRYPNGNVYDGQFMQGQRSGFGVLVINAIGESDSYNILARTPSIYIGHFKGNWLNGEGILFAKSSLRAIKGPFFNNIFTGSSSSITCRSNDSRTWNECFGAQRYPNGNVYFGEFRDGHRSGLGLIKIMARGNSDAYDIATPSPGIYVGNFRGGRIDGRGMLLTTDGGYFGLFADNSYVGRNSD